MNQRPIFTSLWCLSLLVLAGCASESHVAISVEKPVVSATSYSGSKSAVVVGQFDNRSAYMRGIFSDGVDRLGGQAKTILMAHLNSTGRFTVLDRDNMPGLAAEAGIAGKPQLLKGAAFMLAGDVVEFGRKETGDQQLFGILGSGRKQTAYSKVTLNVIDVLTSQVVFSASGAGEYALSDREIIGFGGSSGYDSTLNGKVLDLAIREAVDRLAEGFEQGLWKAGR